jgi:hypothetical protein
VKVSLNWLKQYVDVKLPVAEIANRLTLAGIEVKSTNVIGANWEGVTVGKILEVNPASECRPFAPGDAGSGQPSWKPWSAARPMSPSGVKSPTRRSAPK